MKQQIRLTESDLQMVIEGAVKSLLKEYGDKESTRNAMADAARKAIMKRGDDSVYHNAMNSLNKRNSTKKEFSQFQDRFEKGNIEEEEFNEQPANNVVGENKRPLKITENQLFSIIKESVNKILNEIGDTPRGNFALNAVRGRRAAKRYRTNMGANAEAENNKVMGMADDTAWMNYQKNPKLGYNNEAGYRYGFDKGVEKYGKA